MYKKDGAGGKKEQHPGTRGNGAEAAGAGESRKRRGEKMPFMVGWGHAPGATGRVEGGTARQRNPKKNTVDLETKKGNIHLENRYPPDRLRGLAVDPGICMFSRNDPDRQKKALVNVASSPDGNVVVGICRDRMISYIGIHHPSARERWGKPGYPWLFELGAIEVSRAYRRIGLAEAMLQIAFDDPFYEDKIVLTTGFTWHWDLETTGLDKMQYRAIGIELFGRFGFMEMVTDEPNVTMDSANLFLVRLGKDVPFSKYQEFASLLFTSDWEAMLRGF